MIRPPMPQTPTDPASAKDTHAGDVALDRRLGDRRAIPPAALELADLQQRLTSMAATAGMSAAMLVGTSEFQRESGRIEAFAEAARLVSDRIAVLTGGAR